MVTLGRTGQNLYGALQASRTFLIFCSLLAGCAVFRWFYLIDRYSVNILFWDQWDFYSAFFFDKQLSLWELFTWQHSPHRQGLGFIITKIINHLSGWNTRVECFAAGGIMVLTTLLFAALKRKLLGRWTRFDVILLLIVLTPLQYEIFCGTPNLSHGSVPIFLMALYCLAWLPASRPWRYSGLLLINFLMIYTGFGIFIGVITPILLVFEGVSQYRQGQTTGLWLAVGALIVAVFSAYSFTIGYTFHPAVEGFSFPHPQSWKYPLYILVGLANFWGVKGVGLSSLLAGGLTFSYLCWLLYLYGHQLTACTLAKSPYPAIDKNISLIICTLILFTLLFLCNTAVGRLSLGMHSAQSSRYITYMIPAFVAIYLHISRVQAEKPLLILLLLLGLGVSTAMIKKDLRHMEYYATRKQLWKERYLETEDIKLADKASGEAIHPAPGHTGLKSKLGYLKEKKLNLYLDSR